MAPTMTELRDLFWRSFWTFVQSFLGSMLALPLIANLDLGGTVVIDLNMLQTAAGAAVIAGFSAVASVIKTFASNKLGTGTATTRVEPAIGNAPVVSPLAKTTNDVR